MSVKEVEIKGKCKMQPCENPVEAAIVCVLYSRSIGEYDTVAFVACREHAEKWEPSEGVKSVIVWKRKRIENIV